jgi:hypothetical protein
MFAEAFLRFKQLEQLNNDGVSRTIKELLLVPFTGAQIPTDLSNMIDNALAFRFDELRNCILSFKQDQNVGAGLTDEFVCVLGNQINDFINDSIEVRSNEPILQVGLEYSNGGIFVFIPYSMIVAN